MELTVVSNITHNFNATSADIFPTMNTIQMPSGRNINRHVD